MIWFLSSPETFIHNVPFQLAQYTNLQLHLQLKHPVTNTNHFRETNKNANFIVRTQIQALGARTKSYSLSVNTPRQQLTFKLLCGDQRLTILNKDLPAEV